jgi:hypothetical protein
VNEIRLRYHAADNIIEVDATGVKPTPRIIDSIFDQVIAAARSARSRPYLLTCWAGVELDVDSARRYGVRMEELKPLIVEVVRYEVGGQTKVQIRSEAIKHKLSANRTRFFDTRDEALEAIRKRLV